MAVRLAVLPVLPIGQRPAAIRTFYQSGKNLCCTVLAFSAAVCYLLLYLPENLLTDNRLLRVLHPHPFTLGLAYPPFVLKGNVRFPVVDGMADIGFIFHNALDLGYRPCVAFFLRRTRIDVCKSPVTLKVDKSRRRNLFLNQYSCDTGRPSAMNSKVKNLLHYPAGFLVDYQLVFDFRESYGIGDNADIKAENIELLHEPGKIGLTYDCTGLVNMKVELNLPGKFSVYNSLCAIAITRHFDVDEEALKETLKHVKVKGRIELVKVSDDFTLMIDYAHNAMALESILTTLKEYHPHRLVCLFGCGGNRSKERRYEMGEVSGKLADLTIITSDNPRFEEPEAIIEDIKTGIAKTTGKHVDITDRKEAIKYAIEHGEPGDIIVLAGKGHEDYQEIKGVKYPMDERVLIKEVLEELKAT